MASFPHIQTTFPSESLSAAAYSTMVPPDGMQEGTLHTVETIIGQSQRLQDDLKKLGLKIKHHEDNLKFLKNQTNSLDEAILEMQVILGKYRSSNICGSGSQNHDQAQSEQLTVEHILKQDKAAAGLLCHLKIKHRHQATQVAITKDVVGIVALLGKVINDNLSRVLANYVGLETMMAIVCKTYEGMKALEMHDQEGHIDRNAGLHGLGLTVGKPVDGRFLVICLEHLRPYTGAFVADDPQKKLDLLEPKLPDGERPHGFLGFAVNMIHVDNCHVAYLTKKGHGLRETLFYNIFYRLQVYNSRVEMHHALPCIVDGAVSLDGGMIKSPGMFSLGSGQPAMPAIGTHRMVSTDVKDSCYQFVWNDSEVRFTVSSGKTSVPMDIIETEEQVKFAFWEKERLYEDMQREQALLLHAKTTFDLKKEEFLKFLSLPSGTTDVPFSPYLAQMQIPGGRK